MHVKIIVDANYLPNLIPRPRQLLLKIHNLFDLHQKPAVNFREVENLLDAEAGAQGVADEEDPLGVGHAEFLRDEFAREDVAVAVDFHADAPGFAIAAQAAAANLQRAQAFLQAFLDRPANGHRFAHDLKFLVGERLDGRDGDAVAGVNAHRVEVFDGANDDAVVGLVAHDFHLEFLPAEQRFLDENFRDGRKLQAALGDFLELLAVVSDAAARAAEREAGADDERVTANLFRDGAGFVERVGRAADGHVEAD